MPIADRGDAALVSRHLTYAVGADVCYGKWGEGSYTTGKPSGGYKCSSTKTCKAPDDWTGTTALFELNLQVKKPLNPRPHHFTTSPPHHPTTPPLH